MQLLAIGEVLWDVFDPSEILGGAPLNFSAAAKRLGEAVALVTAVGEDLRGRRALDAMRALGLSTDFVQVLEGIDTGTARVTTDGAGNATFFIPRPAAFDAFRLDDARLSAIESLRPEWLYFGTLAQTQPAREETLQRILDRLRKMDRLPAVKCFYDVNLREGHWNLPLVERLSALATIVKLNEAEAETLFRRTRAGEAFSLEQFCRRWSSIYGVETICVTRGSQGCSIFRNGALQPFAGFRVKVVDTVGAGDAFAAAFLHGYGLGWPIDAIASFANALGALVSSRAGATSAWTPDECLRLIEEQNTRGGGSIPRRRGNF